MSRGLDEATASLMHGLSSSSRVKDKSQFQQEKGKEEKEKERHAKEIDKDQERRDKEREREERRERRKEKERRREARKQKKELSKTSMSKSDDMKRSMDGPIVSEDLLRAAGIALNEIGDIPDADVDVPHFKRTTILTETELRSCLEEATENEDNEQGFQTENTFEQLMLEPHPLIADLLSREKRRIDKKGAFTLADFVSDAELLQSLLQYLTFYDWSLLASVSRAIRIVMVQKKDVREEILERYLSGTIGYQRWSWDEPDPLSLSIQVSFFFSRVKKSDLIAELLSRI